MPNPERGMTALPPIMRIIVKVEHGFHWMHLADRWVYFTCGNFGLPSSSVRGMGKSLGSLGYRNKTFLFFFLPQEYYFAHSEYSVPTFWPNLTATPDPYWHSSLHANNIIQNKSDTKYCRRPSVESWDADYSFLMDGYSAVQPIYIALLCTEKYIMQKSKYNF